MSPRFKNMVPETVALEKSSTKHDRPDKHVVPRRELTINVRSRINAKIHF